VDFEIFFSFWIEKTTAVSQEIRRGVGWEQVISTSSTRHSLFQVPLREAISS